MSGLWNITHQGYRRQPGMSAVTQNFAKRSQILIFAPRLLGNPSWMFFHVRQQPISADCGES